MSIAIHGDPDGDLDCGASRNALATIWADGEGRS